VASGAAAVVVALFITALVMIGLFWGYFMLLRYPQSQNNNSNHEDKGKDDEKAKLGGGQQSPPPSPLLSPTWTLFSIYCVGGVLSLLASRILTTAADDNGERHFLLHSLLSPSSSPLEFIALLIRAIQIIFISPLQEEIIFRWVILRIVHQQYLTYYNHLRQAANTNTSSTINNSNNNNNNKEADQQPPPQSWIITSILISSCLFSFVHLLNVFNGGGGGGGGYVMIQSVLAGVTGLAFAVASLIEEPRPMMKHSIPPTLKLHVLNNVMALLFFGAEPSLGQDGGWWMATSCPFLPCTSSKLTFDLIICLCWLLLLYYSKTRLTF
jgi:membrane protease YdiL (CAAX protease family)